MASSDGLQYRALYEYKKDREEDLALCPGDLVTVSKAGLLGTADYKEGDERSPKGWLNGFNERTKERGDFPGTYVEYLGPVRIVATALKARPRPVPPTPTSQLWGIDNEALYRAPPGSFSNPELKQALLTDAAAVDMDPFDGQTLAEALKWYLHDLPCPVIHPAIYSELIYTAQETQSLEECGQRVKMVLESPTFPQQHGLLLQHLTSHFCKLGQNSSKSHLTPRALGELFGEVLFRPPASCTDVNSEHHAKIIEALIVAGGVAEMQAAPGARIAEGTVEHMDYPISNQRRNGSLPWQPEADDWMSHGG
ncbi:unnamed protein product [Caretta caretta]